ncbi:hypothetical protein MRX96_016577 [Rhipicephalus microplus]
MEQESNIVILEGEVKHRDMRKGCAVAISPAAADSSTGQARPFQIAHVPRRGGPPTGTRGTKSTHTRTAATTYTPHWALIPAAELYANDGRLRSEDTYVVTTVHLASANVPRSPRTKNSAHRGFTGLANPGSAKQTVQSLQSELWLGIDTRGWRLGLAASRSSKKAVSSSGAPVPSEGRRAPHSATIVGPSSRGDRALLGRPRPGRR